MIGSTKSADGLVSWTVFASMTKFLAFVAMFHEETVTYTSGVHGGPWRILSGP